MRRLWEAVVPYALIAVLALLLVWTLTEGGGTGTECWAPGIGPVRC